MKSYTITVNGNVYDVTVEEKGGVTPAAAPAPQAAPVMAQAPQAAPAPAAKSTGAGSVQVKAGAAGKVFKIEASVGQTVKRGDAVVVIEAMKDGDSGGGTGSRYSSKYRCGSRRCCRGRSSACNVELRL